MQEIIEPTFAKIYGMKENPFMILSQNDELTRSVYYSKDGDEIELTIDRNIALPKSLVIKRRTGEIVEYRNIENEIQLTEEDKELIKQVMDRVIEENGNYGVRCGTGNDPIMFSLQYLLAEGGYKNIVFDDIDMRLSFSEKNEEFKEFEASVSGIGIKYHEGVRNIAITELEKLRCRIEQIIQNRPENSTIIIPYANYLIPYIRQGSHAVTLIIETDENKQFEKVNIVDSDVKTDVGGEYYFYLGMDRIFPNIPCIGVSNTTYQNDSCYLMATQTTKFIQEKINSGRSVEKILRSFNQSDKFELIDIMRQNPTIMALNPFTDNFNNPDYYLYTTKGIERKINELKENNQFTKENIKKLLDDIIIFSSENKIDLDKLTKRLIKCRTALKTVSPGAQKLFDEAIKAEQSDDFTIKFKQKNYTHEDTKRELTSFVSRISGITPREQQL